MKTTPHLAPRWRCLLGAALFYCAGSAPLAAASAAPVELIPRHLLFGNPGRTAPQLTPDGTMLSFLAPRDGVMNLWVCPVGKLDEAKPLTAEKTRPLRSYSWSRNSNDLLYTQDTGGDENFLLVVAAVGASFELGKGIDPGAIAR